MRSQVHELCAKSGVQINCASQVCICSAVPSGYWPGGGGPVQAVAEGCSVSGQAAVSSAISSAVLNCRYAGVLQMFDNEVNVALLCAFMPVS